MHKQFYHLQHYEFIVLKVFTIIHLIHKFCFNLNHAFYEHFLIYQLNSAELINALYYCNKVLFININDVMNRKM